MFVLFYKKIGDARLHRPTPAHSEVYRPLSERAKVGGYRAESVAPLSFPFLIFMIYLGPKAHHFRELRPVRADPLKIPD